jgi:CheY-like chemotaxis protein
LTIVRNHGGHMRVFSEVGKGTRFEVYLPAAPVPVVHATIGDTAKPPRGGGQTVLVVDDEESVRRVLRSTLEKAGYIVMQAANGREALTIYGAHGPAIAAVVIDMTMPVLGGVPTMRELVKMNPEVRIIAASGIHDNEAVARSIGSQMTAFLAKPFTSEQLLKAVAVAVTGSEVLPATHD